MMTRRVAVPVLVAHPGPDMASRATHCIRPLTATLRRPWLPDQASWTIRLAGSSKTGIPRPSYRTVSKVIPISLYRARYHCPDWLFPAGAEVFDRRPVPEVSFAPG